MEELLTDFLAEANDQLSQVERQIVRFENNPSDADSIAGIFRLLHTLKGTSGFLDLPRLERLTHAAETLIGKARDNGAATPAQVDLILQTVDLVNDILEALSTSGKEPAGDDQALIEALESAAEHPHVNLETRPSAEPAKASHAPPDPQSSQTGKIGSVDQAAHDRQAALAPRENNSIRVTIGTLERIMRLVSELVLTRNQLMELSRRPENNTIAGPLQRLSAITTDLQDSVMQARMQPIDRLFASLPRIVRELCHELDKRATLVIEGADTELDRQLIETIRDPLMHIIRNCIDHGIESPEQRLAAHKSQEGVIRITASQDAGFISIRISDDGRGIDVARVREKVLDLELADAARLATMSNDELCRFVFAPGFSTAGAITNVSGRGVGMDIVRENVESIGGAVSLATTPGQGTTIILKVPLTLAIVPALIFSVGGHRFAIPQDSVLEAVSCKDGDKDRLSVVQGNPFFTLRDTVMPVADMNRVCGLTGDKDANSPPQAKTVIISRIGSTQFAITVDVLFDVQEIVVKPLSSLLTHINVFAGNTILGDGSVVLIVNPVGLAGAIGLDSTKQYSIDTFSGSEAHQKDATNFILFKAGNDVQKALPLSLLSRIEEADSDNIHNSDGRMMLTHDGQVMPIVDLAGFSKDRKKWPVLVVGVGGAPMGLLVSEIVDTVEHVLEIDVAGQSASVIGTTRIRNELTEILDITHYMQTARPDEFARRHARRFRVLIVDDKPFFRDMLAPLVAASGYEVNTAASGAEALAIIRRGGAFDAILTDVDMPAMNGYELTKAIRELPAYADTPIIALDAYAGEEVLFAARNAGMEGVVGKFDRRVLIEKLQKSLSANAFQNSAIESEMHREHAA